MYRNKNVKKSVSLEINKKQNKTKPKPQKCTLYNQYEFAHICSQILWIEKIKFLIITITRKYINPCNVFVSSFADFVFPSSLWSFVFIGSVYEKQDLSRKLNFYNVLILGLLFQVLLEIYFWFLYFVGCASSFILEEHIYKIWVYIKISCKNWVFFWMLNVLIL